MEEVIKRTYVQPISVPNPKGQDRLLDISKECALVYNTAKETFWSAFEKDVWLRDFDIQKEMSGKINRVLLGSDSYIASIQQFSKAVKTWIGCKKEYLKHPDKFSGEPRPPTKDKESCPIYFKNDSIKHKNGYLLLSLKQGQQPISVKWDIKVGKPVFAVISWKRDSGWQLSVVLEFKVSEHKLNPDKTLAIDLGVKRIATSFDGKQVITYSGKYEESLVRLRNKVNGKTQSKLSKLKKHSRRYKKIKQANRLVVKRIKNKQKDFLHKCSRTIVNQCIRKEIGHIVFGDYGGVHTNTDTGKNNQSIQQNPDQKLRKYVQDKFEVIGGTCSLVPEYYTSKTCPKCGRRNTPKNRDYKCKKCKFSYDRDGVGSINIYDRYKNVSVGTKVTKVLDVVGSLTEPIGWKYNSNRDCLVTALQ